MLLVRQQAWLGATPEGSKQSRLETIQASKDAPEREPSDEEADETPKPLELHVPDCPIGYEYLLGLFYEAGQCTPTGMGLVPLSYTEIQSFISLLEYDLTSFEISCIRKMSEGYCSEASQATDKTRPAPYQPEVVDVEQNRKMVLDKAIGIFGRYKKIKG